MKYIDADKMKAEIERLKEKYRLLIWSEDSEKSKDGGYKIEVLNELMLSLPEERPSENIGQLEFLRNTAIEMIAALEHDISISIYDGEKGRDPEAEKELKQWRSALEWLEHFCKPTKKVGEELDAEIGYFNHQGLSILTERSIRKMGFKEGDKVKIIIIKEDSL